MLLLQMLVAHTKKDGACEEQISAEEKNKSKGQTEKKQYFCLSQIFQPI